MVGKSIWRHTVSCFIALWCAVLCVCASAQSPAKPVHLGSPVVFDGRLLFRVYSDLGPFKPADRARVISQRLRDLAKDPSFTPSEFHVNDQADGSEIAARNVSVATVTDNDAAVLQRSRREIADDYARRLSQAIVLYRKDRTASHLAVDFLGAALAILLLIVGAILISKASGMSRQYILRHSGRSRWVRYHQIALVFDSHVKRVLIGAVSFIQWIAVIILVCWCLTVVLGSFPWTQGYSSILLDTLTEQVSEIGIAVASSAPNFINILIIVVIAYYILKVMRLLLEEVRKGRITIGQIDSEVAAPTYRLVKYLILAAAVVAIFPYVPGSKSRAFAGISVFLGVLVSLGASSAMSNLIAGIVVTYMRPFRIGDRVQIGDTVGDILDRTDLVTRVRTSKNVVVTIPNAALLTTQVVNYSSLAESGGLILHTSVTINYETSWRQVYDLLIAAARQTIYVLAEPEPFVQQTALNNFYVTYELNVYTRHPSDMSQIYSELHANIQDVFAAAGIEIMSPQQISLYKGGSTIG